MSVAEKIEVIKKELEETYNAKVTTRTSLLDIKKIAFNLIFKDEIFAFLYFVDEEAIEMSDPHNIYLELTDIFDALIWESVRRK